MMIFMSTCRDPDASENETEYCYGGGFIDDLSAPRRIIITPTNETYRAYVNKTTQVGWFEEEFMNALTPGTQAYQQACDLVSEESDARPGVTSFLEAFIYARMHDMGRIAVRNPSGRMNDDPWKGKYQRWWEIDESPWLDDGGNFKPNFVNGTDIDSFSKEWGWDAGDSYLAMYTWLYPSRYRNSIDEDVNTDWKVDVTDVSMASHNFGSYWESRYYYRWCSKASLVDICNTDQFYKVDVQDLARISRKYGWHYP
jgi:hypothetical protein